MLALGVVPKPSSPRRAVACPKSSKALAAEGPSRDSLPEEDSAGAPACSASVAKPGPLGWSVMRSSRRGNPLPQATEKTHVFDLGTAVHHDLHILRLGLLCRLVIANVKLHPDRFGLRHERQCLIDDTAGR